MTGYWHINAHRPELTQMSHEGGEWKRWQVEVHETRLKLSGISESNQNTIMMFSRISEFPE